ncbi:MAG: 6-phosphofructokinase [Candidatus Sumerlaeaceae bacterium]
MARYGILTGGGDCPGLNAVLRAAGKILIARGHEVIGFEDGFLGIMESRYRTLSQHDLSGILAMGGTILGTSNRDNPFKWCSAQALTAGEPQTDCSDQVVALLEKLEIEGLIIIGGDGSLSIAHRLHEEKGVRCVGVPKTIDNDLQATDLTFGFDTAVQIATECIDRLHSTAMSHHRAMVVEIMGRYAGWLALNAGVAGGADVILIPEIPYSVDAVCRVIRDRSTVGKRFSILAVSEGAKPVGGGVTVAHRVAGSHDPIRLGGIAQRLATEIEDLAGVETRATVLGHIQRGGSPSSMDRLLATGFGHLAAELVLEKAWGQMAAYQCGTFAAVPIKDAVSRLKLVPADNTLVAAARAIGVGFGDA